MSKLRRKFGKRMKYNYKRTFVGLFLFLFVLCFGVGYAYLSTNLSIDGTSHVKSAKWDVHFENVQISTESVTATQEPTITDDTTVNFGVTLSSPGDKYEFTVDLVNEGTLNAILSEVTILPELTPTQRDYFKYTVTYADGMKIEAGDMLNVDASEKIKIYVEYKDNGDSSDMYPQDDETINFSLMLECAQDSIEEEEIINGIKYSYNLENSHKPGNNVLILNQKIPRGMALFDTAEEALYGLLYIKTNIENSIVKEANICFEYESNSYCLKGGIDESSLSTKPVFEENKLIMETAFSPRTCGDNVSECRFNLPTIQVQIYDNGNVYAVDGYGLCGVQTTGKISCMDPWTGH